MATTAELVAPDPRRKSVLWRLLRLSLLIYLGIVLMFTVFETSLVYFPSKYPQGDWSLPADAEDASFKSADGTELHGWFLKVPQPRAVVLFSHGNGGSIGDRSYLLDMFRKLNVSVLMWDYRGYGKSQGSPDEAGILADARAARTWLAKHAGVPEDQIVLWGESLGGGVSVDLAQDGARGLILENTFSSLPDVAAHHYPWLPTRTLMRNRYQSLDKIAKYRGPLLQLHGDADSIVPFSIGRKLFDAANEPKQFVTISGGDHNDPRTMEFYRAVDGFIAGLKGPVEFGKPDE